MTTEADAVREALELAMHANHRDYSPIDIEQAAGQALAALDRLLTERDTLRELVEAVPTFAEDTPDDGYAEWQAFLVVVARARAVLAAGTGDGGQSSSGGSEAARSGGEA